MLRDERTDQVSKGLKRGIFFSSRIFFKFFFSSRINEEIRGISEQNIHYNTRLENRGKWMHIDWETMGRVSNDTMNKLRKGTCLFISLSIGH